MNLLNYFRLKTWQVLGMLLITAISLPSVVWAQGAITVNQASVSLTIPEKNFDGSNWTPSKPVGKITAFSSEKPLFYSITTTGIPFRIKKGTDQLLVGDGSVLDYETKATWTFNISATDGEQTATATYTVNLTDVNESPTVSELKTEYKVNENTSNNTSIGSFNVVDTDAEESLTYTITGVLPSGLATTATNLSDIFTLNETANNNGTRTVAICVKKSGQLDYEALYNSTTENARYLATITIKDKANHSVSVNTFLEINDVNETSTAKGGTFYLYEQQPIGSPVGTSTSGGDYAKFGYFADSGIGKVEATDPDIFHQEFSTLTYEISAHNSGQYAQDAKRFMVNKYDGRIYSNAFFDYETEKHNYRFYISVSDGEFTNDVEVTVKLLDVEETASHDNNAVIIREDIKNGTIIDDIAAYLASINDDEIKSKRNSIVGDITYSLNKENDVFEINSSTGEIKILDCTQLDFETLHSKNGHIITLPIVASGKDSKQDAVVIEFDRKIEVEDVNESPICDDSEFTILESTSDKAYFGTIEAKDPDKEDHSFGFNRLTYVIISNTDIPFEINSETGQIKLREGQTLNYAKQHLYEFEVAVMDHDPFYSPLRTSGKVTINVVDENYPPKFKTLGEIYEVDENVSVETVLEGKSIEIYDDDDADKNQLSGFITDNDASLSRNAANLFEVVQVGSTNADHISKFVIKTKSDVDYETLYQSKDGDALFNVTLTIEDTHNNQISRNITIRVKDENEEPGFSDSSYAFDVETFKTTETVLGTIRATDRDIYSQDFGTINFSLEGDEAHYFDIDPTSGVINLINHAQLDNVSKSSYGFLAVATDGKNIKKCPVTIQVVAKDITTAGLTIGNVTYTGQEQSPIVKDGDDTLVYGTDYTAEYPNGAGINAGTHNIKIKGMGHYKGELNTQFVINPKAITADITVEQSFYTGEAQLPVIKDGETTLVKETDYTISSTGDCIDAGSYSVVIDGMGNYNSSITKTFTIGAKTVTNPTIILSTTSYEFDGTAKEPTVTMVKDGNTVIPATEYSVNYEDNNKTGTATVVITDKDGGNYTVSGTAQFEITPPTVDDVTVEVPDATKKEVAIKTISTTPGQTSVTVPATVVINNETYQVEKIADEAFKGMTDVTEIVLPETDEPIEIGTDALKIDDTHMATVIAPLKHLDDYAVDPELEDFVKAGQLKATVTPVNKYWTLSSGVDLKLPADTKVYKCTLNSAGTGIEIHELEAATLSGVIMANNGVLVSSTAGSAYDVVVSYNAGINSIATHDAKSYGADNLLEPVIQSKHYEPGLYYVLKDNEFHAITDDASQVPAGKAVLKRPSSIAAARRLAIGNSGNGTTGIEAVDNSWQSQAAKPSAQATTDAYYNLNGSKTAKPSRKGVYINNRQKVIVK